jgi:diguanylate cyclase (GGDEF)-like protein
LLLLQQPAVQEPFAHHRATGADIGRVTGITPARPAAAHRHRVDQGRRLHDPSGCSVVTPAVRRTALAAWCFIGAAVLGAAVYAVLGEEKGTPILGLVALGTLVAIGVGARVHRRSAPLVWRWFALAVALFIVGSVLRSALAGAGGQTALWADTFTLPGYAALAAALLGILRARRAGVDAGSRSDSVVVGAGAVLLAWAFLVVPTLAVDGGSVATRVVQGLYPPVDALLLLLVARIALTDVSRAPAFWLLLTATALVFVGDLGYAISLAELAAPPAMVLDAPFVVAYGALGAAALHPSAVVLTAPQPLRVRPLLRGRLVTVGVALIAPVVVILAAPPVAMRDRVVLAAGVMILMGAVLSRTVHAVNQHARSESILADQSMHDALTGLANRTMLAELAGRELAEAEASAQSVAVLLLDLDRFKVLNDGWGHGAGDELLVAVANRLRRVVRERDCVARSGGDEFAILCPVQPGDQHIHLIAARVFGAFDEPFTLSIGDIVITPSIGLVVAHGAGYTPERLLRDADTAMYRAKDAGRNRWVQFDESMHEAVAGRLSTEQKLRRAMDDGGMSLHYQPIVDLASETVSGFEALARMEIDGERVPPDVFIPVAEDSGLILPLGRWVLSEALGQLARWRSANPDRPDLYMSVNLSARQLRDTMLLPLVRESIADGGIPASCVRLEITESVLMDDAEAALLVLRELRAVGVQLSVDDFGTGYSSLGYLKRFPVSTVKIDRSFVAGLVDNADDQAIVRAVMAMAQALGLDVTAEGVETVGHRDCLRALGCESAQGWYYGRPLPAAEAAEAFLVRTPAAALPA